MRIPRSFAAGFGSSFLVLGLLLSAPVVQGQDSTQATPQFQDCRDQKYPGDCSSLKWKQWQKDLRQQLSEASAPSVPAKLEAKIRVSMTGSAQLVSFHSFLAPADYRRSLETAVANLGPQLAQASLGSTYSLNMELDPDTAALPPQLNIQDGQKFPRWSYCKDYRGEMSIACYLYAFRKLARDRADSNHLGHFSMNLVFREGKLQSVYPQEYPSDPELFHDLIAELKDRELQLLENAKVPRRADDYRAQVKFRNLPADSLKKDSFYLAKIARHARELSPGITSHTVQRYLTEALNYRSAKHRNIQLLKALETAQLDSLRIFSEKTIYRAQLQEQIQSPEPALAESKNPGKVADFSGVEMVPTMKGCATDLKLGAQKICFQRKVLTSVGNNFEYPKEAQEAHIGGRIYVYFVVEKSGRISSLEVLRGVHPSLDLEAMRVVSMLEIEKPAYQRGEAVRMSFTLPINARLK